MKIASWLVGAAAVVSMGLAGDAMAVGLDSCGDFLFDASNASLECEVQVEGGCTASCEPIAFQVECAADLQIGCTGECAVELDVECAASCQGTCEADCEGGNFECTAYCEGNCDSDCSATCSGADNEGQCLASCQANCQAECGANCEANAPDCQAECQGCCAGECTASANAACQIECQASGYASCEANLQGGCEAQCSAPEGALFCDGQWVDAADFDACIAEIQSAYNIEVSGYAEAECEGSECTAEAGGSVSCAMSPSGPSSMLGFAASVLALGLVAARRRRA